MSVDSAVTASSTIASAAVATGALAGVDKLDILEIYHIRSLFY